MFLHLLATGGGLVLLTAGTELLVRGAASLARTLGLSPLVIGLTVVSVGTSLPELTVSLDAVLQSNQAIGIGNVVGSNISNIVLILGLSALLRPMDVKAKVVRIDAPILVVVVKVHLPVDISTGWQAECRADLHLENPTSVRPRNTDIPGTRGQVGVPYLNLT